MEQEGQQTGSFIYDLYSAGLTRRPGFAEIATDHQRVIGGARLEAEKAALVQSFVQRSDFVTKYQANTTAESFVDALIQNVRQYAGVDLSSQRDSLVNTYRRAGNVTQSRADVVRIMA